MKCPPTAHCLVLLLAWQIGARGASPSATIDFGRDIQPILSDACYQCHGPDEATRKADLRLDSRESAFRSQNGRSPVVAGHSDASEVIRRIRSTDPDEQMPPPKAIRRLAQNEIDLLQRWIDAGAVWGKHWAFVPPRRPDLPKVAQTDWPQNAIDSFILARLESAQLKPSPEAPKETLIRRLTLDLTGIPPSPGEVDAFVSDISPGAYEKAVDRLLASPRYGERMVWEWLEAARYADSNGYQGDPNRTMWHWRDWATQALNNNQPFDDFTVEQLAGDLLPDPALPQKIATGFHRNHMINAEGGRIEEESRVDYVQDRVETTATVWMGLTMTCARCHDHKYDPISQREYYQLYSYFNNIAETGGADAWPNAKPILKLPTAAQSARVSELEAKQRQLQQQREQLEKSLRAAQSEWEASAQQQLAATAAEPTANASAPADESVAPKRSEGSPASLPTNIVAILRVASDKRTDAQKKALEGYFFQTSAPWTELVRKGDETTKLLKDANAAVPVTMIMAEREKPRDTFILLRGAYDKPGDKVEAGLPAVLPQPAPDEKQTRLTLARWLVSPDHPLTARVAVNRSWQTFFGTGLVKTAEDFGVQGEKPSHPDLLDWLATEFVRSDWDVKRLHKLMVMSATYRQSSKVTPALLEFDPENRLLARGARFRLPSWVLRDQALFVSGLVVEKMGGKPVKPYQPPGVWEDATFGQIVYEQDKGEKLYRRSLYTFWRRIVGPTMFFDVANRQNCTVRQPRTNTPLHALSTLNDVTYVEAARAMAQSILTSQRGSDRNRIEYAFRLATARFPTDRERTVLQAALERLRQEFAADPQAAAQLVSYGESRAPAATETVELAAHTGLCNLLLNLDETITRE